MNQSNIDLKPYQICQVATQLFLKEGFDNISMTDIAGKANIDVEDLFTYFGNKQDIVLLLYQTINADWQLLANNLPAKNLADRFEQALALKVDLITPYTPVLGSMMGLLLQHTKISINAPRTSHIRAMGLQTMQKIIDGATDSKTLKNKVGQLPSLLYIMHWAILFLYVQTNDKEKTLESLRLMARMLKKANNLSFFLNFLPFVVDIGTLANKLLNDAPTNNDNAIDREILKVIFNKRKTTVASNDCLENKCDICVGLHKSKVQYFTSQQKPIHFILPAFPAKSPNLHKVLGTKPDLGEEIALMALEDLCKEIKAVYEPGAYLTICSDGRIFSELVGVDDARVSEYVSGIKTIIAQQNLQYINIVNLEDLMEGNSFDELRNSVLDSYAEPLDDLTARLKTNADFKNLFNGIHRFITEDRKASQPEKSTNSVKNESKEIVLKVIRNSNAWTRFLANIYPDAVRLSIHPYPAHSDKIGIQITKATDNWLTPWHGVIVLREDGYLLMKKDEAEAKGARLIYKDNQPRHYTLIPG